jgi:hypothetical protein
MAKEQTTQHRPVMTTSSGRLVGKPESHYRWARGPVLMEDYQKATLQIQNF